MTNITQPNGPRPDHKLTVVLSAEQHDSMQVLCARHHETKIGLIRRLLEAAYRMEVGAQPFCADGQGCKCPMLHGPPTPPPHLAQTQSFPPGGGNALPQHTDVARPGPTHY